MDNDKSLQKKAEQSTTMDKPEEYKEIVTNDFQEQMQKLILNSGSVKTTKEQNNILMAPVNVEDVEIRPDGLIYLPWMEYASRLTRAFGMEWDLVPNGMPKFQNNTIYWGFYLVIKNSFCGYSIGEQEYFTSNSRMSYGDACEGAKSNALMRLCKGKGIGIELWKPSFIRNWKENYAEEYYDDYKHKKLWGRKQAVKSAQNPEPIPNYTPEPTDASADQLDTQKRKRRTKEDMLRDNIVDAERKAVDEIMDMEARHQLLREACGKTAMETQEDVDIFLSAMDLWKKGIWDKDLEWMPDEKIWRLKH